jgi:hypothetical protein
MLLAAARAFWDMTPKPAGSKKTLDLSAGLSREEQLSIEGRYLKPRTRGIRPW